MARVALPSMSSIVRFVVLFLVTAFLMRLFVPENIRSLFRF